MCGVDDLFQGAPQIKKKKGMFKLDDRDDQTIIKKVLTKKHVFLLMFIFHSRGHKKPITFIRGVKGVK